MTEAVDDTTTIPIIEEMATISKREVETAQLRIRTTVEECIHDITAQLERVDIEIERRAVERVVAVAPVPYEDGELLVIPITEERAVVEKRLFVIEEIVGRIAAPPPLRTRPART